MSKSKKIEMALGEHSSRIVFISISMFKNEEALAREVERFFTTPGLNLLLVEVDLETDEAHIDHLHSIISIYERQDKSNSKNVCILIHVKRNREKESVRLVYFQGYSMKMFDGMNENTDNMIDTLNSPITDIVMNEIENSFENKIAMRLSKAFTRVNRTVCGFQESSGGDFSLNLIKKIVSNPKLVKILKIMVKRSIKSTEDFEKKMGERLSSQDSLKYKSVLKGVNCIATDIIEHSLTVLIYHIEKHSAFDSYFNPPPDHAEEIVKFWRRELENLLINYSSDEFPSIISIVGLQFPFSKLLSEKLRDIYRNVRKEEQENVIYKLLNNNFSFDKSNKWMMSLLMRDLLLIKVSQMDMNLIDRDLFDMLLQTVNFSALDISLLTIEQFTSFLNQKEYLLRSYINALQISLSYCSTKIEKILKSKNEQADFEIIVKTKCCKLIDKIIEILEPSKTTMNQFKMNIGVYLCLLTKIKMLAISSEIAIKLKNRDLLSLWISAAECAEVTSMDFLEKTYNYFNKMKNPGQDSVMVLQSSDFLNLMFSIFQDYPKLGNYHKYSLKYTLYLFGLKGSKEGSKDVFFEKMANEFRNPEASPYLIPLVQRIGKETKCLEIKFDEIKKLKNGYINNVNRYLEKTGIGLPICCPAFQLPLERIKSEKEIKKQQGSAFKKRR